MTKPNSHSPISTIAGIAEVARHELMVILRTRRALTIAVLYLGAAILGGLIYVLVVRMGEQKMLDVMINQGADPDTAAQNMALVARQGYHKLAAWLAGVDDFEQIAASWRDSVILPVFFWCSLAFLPFLIILSSFDQLSVDLNSRSLCYSILRVRRAAILLGKMLAHTVVFVLLSAVSSAVLMVCTSILLETVELVPSLWGLFRVWLLLIPFGLCYLAISSLCSACNTEPMPALVSAIAVVIVLWVLSLFGHLSDSGAYAMLRHIRFLSPGTYENGMWLSGFIQPLQSAVAYLGFAAFFTLLAIIRLRTRDL